MTDLQELMALLGKWRGDVEFVRSKKGPQSYQHEVRNRVLVETLSGCADELDAFLRSPAFAEMARAYDDVKSFMSRCDCGCSRYCCPQCGEELVGPLEKVDIGRIDADALAGGGK